MTYNHINIIIIHRQGETHFVCVKRIRHQFPELMIAGSRDFIIRNVNGLAIIRSYFTGSFL